MTIEVHPVADLFPVLPDDELQALTADVTDHGLIHPIVLDTDGRILDGRNRHAACLAADVEPVFTTYDGDDPVAFVISANIHRRHLSKGQAAMIASSARLFLKNSQQDAAAAAGISRAQVAYADAVAKHRPDLVPQVLSGQVPLNNAYAEVQAAKQAKAAEAEAARQAQADAIIQWNEALEAGVYLFREFGKYPDRVTGHIAEYTPRYAGRELTADHLREARDGLDHLIKEWPS